MVGHRVRSGEYNHVRLDVDQTVHFIVLALFACSFCLLFLVRMTLDDALSNGTKLNNNNTNNRIYCLARLELVRRIRC